MLPEAYVELPRSALPAGVRATAREDVAEAVARALAAEGTLHRWASLQPGRRALQGRGVAWSVPLPLPGGPRAVVRHNRHGGLLARLTGDRFLTPTRAPSELAISLRLGAAGVPTPAVLAYALYPAGPLLRRADVASLEIEDGGDLPWALGRWPGSRGALLAATARLIAQLTRAGARHPDLNVKNILLAVDDRDARAYVLDVDRVLFGAPDDPRITEANLDRFARSVRRWHERHGAPLLDAGELDSVARLARGAA